MSIRKLNSEHLQDLAFLTTLDVDYVSEFCRIAIDFITNGGSPQRSSQKLFASAAKRIQCSKSDIERTVTSLSYLFSECAKSNMDPIRLQYALTVMNNNNSSSGTGSGNDNNNDNNNDNVWNQSENHDRLRVIAQCYQDHRSHLRTLLLKVDSTETCFGIGTIPQYKDFEWRLDMECDRRSLMMNTGGGGSGGSISGSGGSGGSVELKPTYMVHLVTNQSEKGGADYNFQMSFDELKHVTDVLGEALKEVKSAHVRRIRHYIH